jgi:putative copper resistance protein D
LQHRLYAALITAFAIFEWAVETGRLKSRAPSYVFPLICAAGGAFLLTHQHALGNVKEEMFAEMSHTPIALLGVTAGWSRWLELRLPGQRDSKIASYLWPVCLALVGLVLLDYRET